MKKYVLITLFILSPLALSTGFATAKDSIGVMSYNVRRKGNDPVEFQWDTRKELVFNQILSKKPAIVGLQEVVQGEQFEDLKIALPAYQSFGKPRSKKAGFLQRLVMMHPKAKDEINPIFYDQEKVELIASGTFGINPTAKLFTAWLPRVCTWGLFEDKESEEQFYVFNTHLDNESASIRAKQLNIILNNKKITKQNQDAPAIVMGDLNTKTEGDIKEIITEAGFTHAKEKAKVTRGPNETRTGWNDNELKEIDHILVKNADVAEYEVIESPKGQYPSDHRPVYAKIVLP